MVNQTSEQTEMVWRAPVGSPINHQQGLFTFLDMAVSVGDITWFVLRQIRKPHVLRPAPHSINKWDGKQKGDGTPCISASRFSSPLFGICSLDHAALPKSLQAFLSDRSAPNPGCGDDYWLWISPRCFTVAQLFHQHSFNHYFLECWSISLLWHSFWHNTASTCYPVYHTA